MESGDEIEGANAQPPRASVRAEPEALRISAEDPPEPSVHGRREKPSVASRGVPSDETLYLPAHDSPALRAFQDKNESLTRNTWGLAEVVQFVFPQKYQAAYHSVAQAFLVELTAKTSLSGPQIAEFVSKHAVSKATFYNRVLPRLRRVGMVKVERQTLVAVESKRKYRPMTIHLSRTFGNYLMKIGDSWLAIVDDARSQYDQQKRLGQFGPKE